MRFVHAGAVGKNRRPIALLALTIAFMLVLGIVVGVLATRGNQDFGPTASTPTDSTSDSVSLASESQREPLPALYVSPDGADLARGDINHPLRTVAEALSRLSAMRASGKVSSTDVYHIWFRGGEYTFDGLLSLGSEASNVTMSAWGDEKVVFSGEHPLRGFSEDTVNGVRMFVKELDGTENETSCTSLFNESGALTVSRYPKKGYLSVVGTDEVDAIWNEKTTPSSLTLGQRSFNASPEEVASISLCDGMQARVLHKWHDELSDVAALDTESGKVSLSRPATLTIKSGDRFCFENVFAAMSDPGEWYIDHEARRLYYVPFEGEDPNQLVLYAAHTDRILSIEDVANLTFNRIRFARTGWRTPLPSAAYSFDWCVQNDMDAPQGAVDVPGVVTIRSSRGVRFTNCEFMDLGPTAIRMEEGVSEAVVKGCLFQNIGASAVFVGGRNVGQGQEGATSSISIVNNKILAYGRRYWCAPGINILFCDQAHVRNNEIAYGRYTGVSCGWVWGYEYQATNGIQIVNNLIYGIGDGSLCDMAGIYTLGSQPGTIISGNVVHDVTYDLAYGYGAWGIFLDEGSSGINVSSNLLFACSNGYYLHYGSANTIDNNIIALNARDQINFGKKSDNMGEPSIYTNNICLTAGDVPVYFNIGDSSTFYEEGNMAWNMSQLTTTSSTLDSFLNSIGHQQQTVAFEITPGTIVDNPLFKDPAGFDFELATDSPAFALGYTSWNYHAAGTLPNTIIGLNRTGGDVPYNANATHRISLQ